MLRDGPCHHTNDEHRDTGDPDWLNGIGYQLRSPGGRAEIADDYGWYEEDEQDRDDAPLDAWVCPAFLRGLADETRLTLA
ncbi:hypothetical protein AB0O68_16165 [Streptomyces sp. NPDC087512]|uniref:hypothetical protein n=1 Tax=Streptomyces sp. NPDC087512 TaxID=3155059 RepID=UPI00341D8C19